jgi:hypothetical protein
MHATAIQTKYRPKAHTGPLWIFHPTFTAFVVAWYGTHCGLIGGGHLHHGCCWFVWLLKTMWLFVRILTIDDEVVAKALYKSKPKYRQILAQDLLRSTECQTTLPMVDDGGGGHGHAPSSSSLALASLLAFVCWRCWSNGNLLRG